MKANEILHSLQNLANGQEFYRRMLNELDENENLDEFLSILEDEHFADVVDLVLFLEGGVSTDC
ncbi:hypothetical protein [Bacillus massiliigorillae]|uniref:hypothetical protein n=1 Tax=Bacillus massiliigorillae TaxID=1243664 RepID=UPI0003AB1F1F|nr:hypothetical protein [Bacillus massiliigorillae]